LKTKVLSGAAIQLCKSLVLGDYGQIWFYWATKVIGPRLIVRTVRNSENTLTWSSKEILL
jgi:hypothetical protein